MTPEQESLASALKRNFIIVIATRPGLRPQVRTVLVVQGYNGREAKQQAFLKMKNKSHQQTSIRDWNFLSIEEVTNENTIGSGNSPTTGRVDTEDTREGTGN